VTLDTEVFLRRTRALVSALALLQQSEAGSATYAGFRAKVEKGLGLVLASVGQVLREALKAAGENAADIDALADADMLRRAGERGLLSAEETGRWLVYFGGIVSGADFAEETLVLLRALLVDARGLEIALRSR
jgi:hypothetical protein